MNPIASVISAKYRRTSRDIAGNRAEDRHASNAKSTELRDVGLKRTDHGIPIHTAIVAVLRGVTNTAGMAPGAFLFGPNLSTFAQEDRLQTSKLLYPSEARRLSQHTCLDSPESVFGTANCPRRKSQEH